MEGSDPRARMRARSYEGTLQEIAQEKAASLGRAGRRLEIALRALREFPLAGRGSTAWLELVAEAGESLYFYIVQREACGLYDSSEIHREMSVPPEVQLRMGLRRPSGSESRGT